MSMHLTDNAQVL